MHKVILKFSDPRYVLEDLGGTLGRFLVILRLHESVKEFCYRHRSVKVVLSLFSK